MTSGVKLNTPAPSFPVPMQKSGIWISHSLHLTDKHPAKTKLKNNEKWWVSNYSSLSTLPTCLLLSLSPPLPWGHGSGNLLQLETGCVALSHLLVTTSLGASPSQICLGTSAVAVPSVHSMLLTLLRGHECSGVSWGWPEGRQITRVVSKVVLWVKGQVLSPQVSTDVHSLCQQKNQEVLLRIWVPNIQRPVYPNQFIEDASPSYGQNIEILPSDQEQ